MDLMDTAFVEVYKAEWLFTTEPDTGKDCTAQGWS